MAIAEVLGCVGGHGAALGENERGFGLVWTGSVWFEKAVRKGAVQKGNGSEGIRLQYPWHRRVTEPSLRACAQ